MYVPLYFAVPLIPLIVVVALIAVIHDELFMSIENAPWGNAD